MSVDLSKDMDFADGDNEMGWTSVDIEFHPLMLYFRELTLRVLWAF